MSDDPGVTAPVPDIRVGFAGLGRMGLPLAMNLFRSGVPVVAYNRTQSKTQPLVSAGGTWVPSPKELGRSVSGGVVFLMLTDGEAVRAVLFGRSGLVRGAKPGTLVVDLSTIDPEESRAFAARLSERGIHYIDAPVGGSVEHAERKEVAFFVGGEPSDVARVRPLLDRMGRSVDHLGPVGSGSAMKLVNNLLTLGNTVLAAEALALADVLGLDRHRAISVLLAGGGRSAMLERKAPAFIDRAYPAQFTSQLALKDLKLIERAGRRGGLPLRLGKEARRLIQETIAQGRAEQDFSSVFETVRRGGREAGAPTTAVPGDLHGSDAGIHPAS